MLIDVVMPSLSLPIHHEMVRQCILSLRESEKSIIFNVMLIESANELVNLGQDTTLAFDLPTYNFHHAINLGLKASESEWVVLANNDLLFFPGWMSAILECKKDYPHIESFSSWEPVSHPRHFGKPPYPKVILGYDTSKTLAGWCLTTTKKVLNTIELSEQVTHWYSDNNYADELKKYNFVHALVTNSHVRHLESQTAAKLPNYLELTQGQYKNYIKIKSKG